MSVVSDNIHPELRPIARGLPQLHIERRWQLLLVRLVLWLFGRSRAVSGVVVEDVQLDGFRVRVYRPTAGASGGALLWFHSGGFVMGMPGIDDRRCSLYCRELGLVVVSVDYRLAPGCPFPAGLDDSVKAWQWLQAAAPGLGVDPARVAVGGESSGGGLAASLTQRLRDQGLPAPAAQMLLHPMLDDRTASRDELDGQGHLVWNNRNNRTAWRMYLGHEPSAAEVAPYAVPARMGDLSRLPSAWIGVAGLDLFSEENRDYARRLRAAGVPCTEEVVDTAFHGFSTIVANAPVSDAFFQAQLEFLQGRLCVRDGRRPQ